MSRRRAASERELFRHLESVAFVQRPVPRRGRLQEGRHAVAIAVLEHRRESRCAEPATLPLRIDADERQVVVGRSARLGGVSAFEAHKRAKGPGQVPPEYAEHRRQQAQLPADPVPPPAGWLPHGDAGHVGRREGLLLLDPHPPQEQLERAAQDRRPAGIGAQDPAEHRVVVEGACQHAGHRGCLRDARPAHARRLLAG